MRTFQYRPTLFAPALLLLASLLSAALSPASAQDNATFLSSLTALLGDAVNSVPVTTTAAAGVGNSAYLQAVASEWWGVVGGGSVIGWAATTATGMWAVSSAYLQAVASEWVGCAAV